MSFEPFDFPRSALSAILSNVKELGSRFCHIFSHGLTAWCSLQDWVICCVFDSCSCLGYSSFVYSTYLSLRELATVHSVRFYALLV